MRMCDRDATITTDHDQIISRLRCHYRLSQVFDDLNPSLASEVSLFMHRKMIISAPFFKNASSSLVQAIHE